MVLNNYCFSTPKLVTPTHRNFRLCVYCLYCWIVDTLHCNLRLSVVSRSLAARSEHMWTAHLFRFIQAQFSLPPTIRRSNIQRSTKHLIYCLIKQAAETPPALVELLCTTPSQGCYHVVCSRYDWHRGEGKSLFLPSFHAHIFMSIYSKP